MIKVVKLNLAELDKLSDRKENDVEVFWTWSFFFVEKCECIGRTSRISGSSSIPSYPYKLHKYYAAVGLEHSRMVDMMWSAARDETVETLDFTFSAGPQLVNTLNCSWPRFIIHGSYCDMTCIFGEHMSHHVLSTFNKDNHNVMDVGCLILRQTTENCHRHARHSSLWLFFFDVTVS